MALLTPAAGAHEDRRPASAANPGMFGQRPIALPAQQQAEPSAEASPRADCGPGANPEPSIQGRVPGEEIASGRADAGYWCNVERIGQSGSTGGFKVLRYVDSSGHECAYYDTTLLFPTNATSLSAEPTGVAVLDMTDPRNPVRTASLVTPAMQSPHESLNISVERGLLAAVTGNAAFYPGVVDVYDVFKDCRFPELMASSPVGVFGHESGMAPDGKTFYATSISTGQTTAVDLTNPRVPLPLWVGQYNSHGMSVSDDGNRGYMASGDGLIIVDLSEIQARKPDPRVREISRLTWPNMTIPQAAIPVTISGKPYLVEVDEYSATESGQTTSHGPRVGAARIIDISDETKPFVVSNIRLAVHQPENRDAIAGDPGAPSPVQGYAAHYCNVPQRQEPGLFACSMILSGMRVFDIRDPRKPREVAYYVAPPSNVSASGSPFIDERANWAMSSPSFALERGEVWYSDGTSGFHALRLGPGALAAATPRGRPGCAPASGFAAVSARPSGQGVRLGFSRRVNLPVRIDVFRVSDGRRVIGERRVAAFGERTGAVTFEPRRRGGGFYFARFTMRRDGEILDRRRVVLRRDARGRFKTVAGHHRRRDCGLLHTFKLERPVFGGRRGVPLRLGYRLKADARVTVTLLRGKRVVRRLSTRSRAAATTHRLAIPARGLRRGLYTVRLHAVSGEDQVSATLASRRL